MKNQNLTINLSPKTILLVIATAIALWLVLILKEILLVLLLSIIFTAALGPVIDKMQKKKIPRGLAILGIYVLVVLILVLIVKTIIPPVASQISTFNENKEIYFDKIANLIPGITPTFEQNIRSSAINFINTFAIDNSQGILSGAVSIFSGIIGFVIVLVVSFYLLLEKDGPEKMIAAFIPGKYKPKALSISRKISAKMSSWFRGQLFLCFIIFVLDYIALSVLHVDFALTLAILAGFLELLPIAGPIIAGTLAALSALAISPLLSLIVIIYFFLLQQLENHILVPQIMKKAVGLSPVTVIFAVLIGGKLLGFLGIIIAVPVASAISVLYEELYKNNIGGK